MRVKLTAKSLTIGKLSMGSTVIVSVFNSTTFVKHANAGLPLIFMPHEPHDACLQEYLTATE